MQVAHRIVADAVGPVVDGLRDFHAIGPVEFEQPIRVTGHEIGRARFGTGRARALLQENLDFAKRRAGE